MNTHIEKTLDELVRAGSLLSRHMDFKTMVSVLVEQTLDITASDLACLYLRSDPDRKRSPLRLMYRRGRFDVPRLLSGDDEQVDFITECEEAVVLLERRSGPFDEILLHPDMQSGIALPLSTPTAMLGILYLNSGRKNHYGRERLTFLESYVKLAGGMLHNSHMYQELQETFRRIEELERYQESIFASMTNLLVTTDRDGRIRYFNSAAADRLKLTEKHVGGKIGEVFRKNLDRRILRAIDKGLDGQMELLGIEGIFRDEEDMDFSLNQSPLRGKRGANEGTTLLFTDQTRERELQGQMEQVTEERRLIKDMFTRYLSAEVVQQLVSSPGLVKPGGDKKEATVFFADIRGYTSFSEGKDPAYIIEILNEYFSEAVEIIIKHRGYIDKFIGDAIMAAWGVPLQTVEEDARQAVSCALEIQDLVKSRERKFFRGGASSLRIGIGMHTGPLVAGNLGSVRRMNYTVIGDTVNIASRLEGVAKAGEVIITQDTLDRIGERFKVEKKQAVKVKGKARPIPIYRVLKQVS
jgi:class 3 adenylate cyclase/PAS domain-containing protein